MTDESVLTEAEVYDVLKFAGQLYQGVYNPMLVSSRLQDITMQPMVADSTKVQTALHNPKESEDELLGYSEFFELTSMMYKRVLRYLSGILAFDLTYVCTNIDDASEYSSRQYLKDRQAVWGFLDRFNIKQQFKMVMNQILRQETFFCILRDEGNKFVLQELPPDYCKITGRWDYGTLFDFNMYWFWKPGVSLEMYPAIFKKLYNKSLGLKPNSDDYVPAMEVGSRTSSWVYWVQTDPADGFWMWKFTPEIATRVPFLAPLFPDVVLQPLIRTLQTNSYMAAASKMLVGEVPMLGSDVKGATVRDAVALSPDTLGKFLAVLKGALSDAIKVGAAPLENIEAVSFPIEDSFYTTYAQTATSLSGINSRLIFTNDRMNATEALLSVDVDEYMIKPIYAWFENFLEYQINRLTKKYKFKFMLEGTEFSTNRKDRLEVQKELANFGMVMPQKFAAALGMLPQDFYRQLEEGRAMEFVDKLTPIQTTFQMPSGGGRPAEDITDLEDEGDNASNDTNANQGSAK